MESNVWPPLIKVTNCQVNAITGRFTRGSSGIKRRGLGTPYSRG